MGHISGHISIDPLNPDYIILIFFNPIQLKTFSPFIFEI